MLRGEKIFNSTVCLQVNSVWFKLFLYNLVGSGPDSLLLVKGTRLRWLPQIFEVINTEELTRGIVAENVSIRSPTRPSLPHTVRSHPLAQEAVSLSFLTELNTALKNVALKFVCSKYK